MSTAEAPMSRGIVTPRELAVANDAYEARYHESERKRARLGVALLSAQERVRELEMELEVERSKEKTQPRFGSSMGDASPSPARGGASISSPKSSRNNVQQHQPMLVEELEVLKERLKDSERRRALLLRDLDTSRYSALEDERQKLRVSEQKRAVLLTEMEQLKRKVEVLSTHAGGAAAAAAKLEASLPPGSQFSRVSTGREVTLHDINAFFGFKDDDEELANLGDQEAQARNQAKKVIHEFAKLKRKATNESEEIMRLETQNVTLVEELGQSQNREKEVQAMLDSLREERRREDEERRKWGISTFTDDLQRVKEFAKARMDMLEEHIAGLREENIRLVGTVAEMRYKGLEMDAALANAAASPVAAGRDVTSPSPPRGRSSSSFAADSPLLQTPLAKSSGAEYMPSSAAVTEENQVLKATVRKLGEKLKRKQAKMEAMRGVLKQFVDQTAISAIDSGVTE